MEAGFAAAAFVLLLAALMQRKARMASQPQESPRAVLRYELARLERDGKLRIGKPGWGRIRDVFSDDSELREAADDALLADRLLEVEQEPGKGTGYGFAWTEQLRNALKVLQRK